MNVLWKLNSLPTNSTALIESNNCTSLLAFLSELLQHYSMQFLVMDISEIRTVVGTRLPR